MYFDDIEKQLHAIININQMLIEKIQKKRNNVFCIREYENGN